MSVRQFLTSDDEVWPYEAKRWAKRLQCCSNAGLNARLLHSDSDADNPIESGLG